MRFLRGDYDASILLLDLERSKREAKLTDRQIDVLFLVFELDMTQQEVAQHFNITQQGVSDHIKGAIRRIARYNRKKEDQSFCA
jgi:predicted DNA-binding protein YlxM (UPF0122 family)